MDNEVNLSKRREKRKRQKKNVREFVNKYLSNHPCSKCGSTTTLTFHHVDPAKKNKTIAALIHGRSITKIKEEIDKCEVLCRHCHDVVHGMIRKENV